MIIIYIAIALAMIIFAWNLPSVTEIVSKELGKTVNETFGKGIEEGGSLIGSLMTPISWSVAISILIFTISMIVIYHKKTRINNFKTGGAWKNIASAEKSKQALEHSKTRKYGKNYEHAIRRRS